MKVSGNKFDLLANYLEPRFGNIYDVPDYDTATWNDELRGAVTNFLSKELPSDVAARLFNANQASPTAADRKKHIDHLLHLLDFLHIGAGCIDEQVHGLRVRARIGAGGDARHRAQRDELDERAPFHDRLPVPPPRTLG